MEVPIAPTIAGLVGVLLVRFILWSKKESIIWNVAVMALTASATFVTLEGHETSTFFGFWIGVGYGGIGVGVVKIGTNMMTGILGERFKNAAQVLFGIKPDPIEDTPEK